MTSLKLQRHNAGWLPKEVVAALREVPASDTTSRMDKRLYSKIELGLADLTVAQAEALAERWDVPIEYIRRPNPAESTESPKIAVATRPKAQAGPGTQVYRGSAPGREAQGLRVQHPGGVAGAQPQAPQQPLSQEKSCPRWCKHRGQQNKER